MVKKVKLDEEALARRASARAHTRRESTKIREAYNKEVLDLVYNNHDQDERTFLKRDSKHNSKAIRATAYVLGDRARKVLTSMGINPPLKLDVMYYRNESKSVNAVTNYHEIQIAFDMGMVDPTDMNKVGELLAALKGVVYHEGGHILNTLPWPVLFDCALMDNNLSPVSASTVPDRWGDDFAKRYPAYLLERSEDALKTIGQLFPNPNASQPGTTPAHANLYHEHVRYFDQVATELQVTWNLLEDGRMEHEMVNNNLPMENYFTALVLNYIVDEGEPGYAWPFVITRTYLDEELLDNVRQLAYKFASDKGMDPSIVDRIEDQVHVFRQAKSATDVVVATWQMHYLITDWIIGGKSKDGNNPPSDDEREGKGTPNPGSSSPNRYSTSGKTQVNEKPTFGDENKGWENKPGEPEKGEQPGEGTQPGEGKQPGEGEGTIEGDGKQPNEGSPEKETTTISPTGGTKGTGGSIKENVDYKKIREDLKAKTKEAVERIVTAKEAEDVIAEINIELMRELPHNGAISQMSGELLADSMAIANQMLSALEPLALTADPAWRFRQEHGVLDPTAYKMHEPGDSDYWVDYEGEGAHGHSLAVSVMLDTSGSMQGWMDQLSVAAYGIRNACDNLGIPCTVSTFDTEPYMMWDHDEVAQPVLIHDGGGTNPLDGLRQIKNQGAGKKRHLVVILTDGEWSHVSSIKPFAQQGQYWLLVGLGNAGYARDLVSRKGGDASIGIEDVMDLPKEIEKALIGFLA